MTRALTLTAAEWEVLQRDGTAWIAWDAINDPCDHIRYACEAPCRRCLGHRWVPGNRDGLDYGYHPHERQPCPDCRVTLVGECPKCRGEGACRECHRSAGTEKATVTLGYAYADSEVLPCVDDPDSVGEAACIHVESAHVAWHWKAGEPDEYAETDISAELAHYGDLRDLVGRYALKVRLA